MDEQRPQLFRTHDGGKTWTEIDRGIEHAPTNVVRADPQRRGLLYAGTERGVWVSFDDGASWSSLRLNLPATSVRDLVVHGDDLVIATHGRGFWILDDITPLRQADALRRRAPTLLAPARAWRVPRDTNTDTPLPPDEPFAANPPDGAMLDYVLPHAASRVVAHDRRRARTVVRRFASDDSRGAGRPGRRARRPGLVDRAAGAAVASAGAHRFVWDLQPPPPRTVRFRSDDRRDPARNAARSRKARRCRRAATRVTLDADGATQYAPARRARKIRACASAARDLQAQYELGVAIVDAGRTAYDAAERVRARDAALARRLERGNGRLARLLGSIETGDGAPTAVQRATPVARGRLSALRVGRLRGARAVRRPLARRSERSRMNDTGQPDVPHPPYDELRAAAGGDAHAAALGRCAARRRCTRTEPDPAASSGTPNALRGIPVLEARIANWWDDPNTQRWVKAISDAGL